MGPPASERRREEVAHVQHKRVKGMVPRRIGDRTKSLSAGVNSSPEHGRQKGGGGVTG